MKKLVMAVVSLLAFGCGGPEDENGDGIADGIRDPNNISVVVPAEPKGTVSGQVLTTQQKPLATANVTLTIGSELATKTVQTDADGNFAFRDIPGGAQVLLTFTKDGFATLRASSTVPTTAGNVPINDGNASFGPVILSELNGTVKFNVIGPDGRPASGVTGTLEVVPAGQVLFGLAERTTSRVVVEATADSSGVLTFDRVPRPIELTRLNGGYLLSINALDTNGDGIYEAGGMVTGYSASQLVAEGTVKTETLPYAYNPGVNLAVSHSNVAALKGGSTNPQFNMIKPGENIYVVFNQPVQPNSVIAGLTDEYGRETLAISKAVTSGGTVLTLTPGTALQPGKEYNLYVRAVANSSSSNGATPVSKTVAFFVGDLNQPQSISIEATARFYDTGYFNGTATVGRNNNQLDSGEIVSISFNQVMRHAGGNYAYVYFDTDLNNSTTFIQGEWNPNDRNLTGFPLIPYEPQTFLSGVPADPTPVFVGQPASGYTSRFIFPYGYGSTSYRSLNAGNAVPLVFAFGRLLSPATDVYESGWGVPQTANVTVSATLTAIPSTP